MFHVPNQYRIRTGLYGTDNSIGNYGGFTWKKDGVIFHALASEGHGWEHVSVHVIEDGKDETPSWDEMCAVKDLFWDETDCVMQFHPAKKDYVNCHPNTLHLWRPVGTEFPTPPKIMV